MFPAWAGNICLIFLERRNVSIISDKVWSFFGPFRWQSSVLFLFLDPSLLSLILCTVSLCCPPRLLEESILSSCSNGSLEPLDSDGLVAHNDQVLIFIFNVKRVLN